mmetsp:Transcript_15159/g.27414  ORF Transcript_15159/g.27414 Transcript_15159/m.27414 type:complete len:215 (-) Transcript_15159:145-789(-)|eukprot:CAMPEP_0201628746 /NCGR_PEP_ID=MMETSP0493-20130528/3618_1 /ASSEMBLY_ACC=CAM_ASM_000838 /TAXON_ID=420259 /ORGANISM="Thalassiosira gravida, Strain GMp14c1" /LENGTH=214 /DNA_ID=CAMNT_0048099585 /DNA_START=88 /DNA_END=732 /DNA_ORIENTATION=+
MKSSIPTLLVAVLGLSAQTAAFAPILTQSTSTTLLRAAELITEPEGGEELLKMSESSLPSSRMKNMGPAEDQEEGVFTFWLTATADGAKIKKLRTQTEKEASKNANFPGFRKGQIPPWAQPQMTGFAVQEAIIKTCEESLEAYGLENLSGSAGEVTVNEDIKDLCKGYKSGDIAFTAKYNGKFDSAVHAVVESPAEVSPAEDVVVDVEVVEEAE